VNRLPLGTRKEVVPMVTVRDVMKPHVMHVAPETPLKDVAQVLIDRRISGVPVVDAQGAVVGVVSEADFLIKEQGVDAVSHRPLSRWFGDSVATKTTLSKLAAVTAGEAMTTPAITIEPTAAISLAAQTMTKRRVNRLPVVDGGKLVGIVTRSDLLRAYVLPDGDIEATIRDDVMRKLLWLDPALFTIVVRDGIVSVGGQVELHSTAESIGRAIAMVPGVIDLHTTVRWSVEDDDIRPVEREPAFPYSPH
jgi:CBS domain-containing protein